MTTERRRKKAAYRKYQRNKFSMFLVSLVVIMILIVVALKRIELSDKMNANQAKIEALSQEYQKEVARKDEIEQYEKYTHTKAYAEEVAHDKLGLVYEGEIIFKEE